MKNYKLNKIKFKRLIIALIGIIAIWSCEQDDDYSPEGETRMFTPGGISSQSFEDRVKLTWDPSLFTDGITEVYTAQVSEDTLFQNVEEIVLEKETDTTGIVFTDQELQVRTQYFVRVKANAIDDRPASNWSISTGFSIRGVQKLYPILSPDILATKVKAEWEPTEGVTQFRLQKYTQDETDPTSEPELIGEPIIVPITAQEEQNAMKTIENLEPDTKYFIDLYKGAVSIGYRSFKTKPESNYSVILTPSDNIVDIVNNSQDGDIIGLEPGTYTAEDGFDINGKTITIESTNNDPSTTKVIYDEFTLKDTGAGITLRGIEFDGQNDALYFINLTSSNGNDDPADFTDVFIDNCIVHGVETSAFRANRGPNSGYTMNSFNIDYSTFYDFAPGSYAFIHLDEFIFNEVNLRNSTFYNTDDLFIRYREDLDTPNPSGVINVEYCTINSIGFSDNYTLLDVDEVQTTFNFSNNILANIPREGGTAREDLIRMENEAASASFSFSNFFNLTTGDPDEEIQVILPDQSNISSQNMFNVELDWDNNTSDFSLPSDSELQTASSSGGPIGAPKWWF